MIVIDEVKPEYPHAKCMNIIPKKIDKIFENFKKKIENFSALPTDSLWWDKAREYPHAILYWNKYYLKKDEQNFLNFQNIFEFF